MFSPSRRSLRTFGRTSPLGPFVPSLASHLIGQEAYPGEQVQTDEEIEKAIRRSYNTIYHGASTCAMGRAKDPMAVVNNQARVISVQGLRVVDAPGFPSLPPGHPQATVCKM
ncbi:GMC oxidoreductase-domain-containing protein [Aspergillus crustosus]